MKKLRNKAAAADSIPPKKRPLVETCENAESSAPFPIVGVGASAGGLEAFQSLLAKLTPDIGMAFVLVQHLDPDHESVLTQLLSRNAALPVLEVTNNLRVRQNHIYVIPPNRTLVIERGHLKLSSRIRSQGSIHCIDVFLESLAKDQGECAIGIILSGTASDGTTGMAAIKAEGGITFAQDDSAKYDSMPRSAIASGCVDLILPPQKIATELIRIAKHPYIVGKEVTAAQASAGGRSNLQATQAKSAATVQEKSFQKILELLHKHSGVDFSLYKPNTIQRRITRRMLLNKIEKPEAYLALLRGRNKELEGLYLDMLINVTSFFRNPQAFEVLKKKVYPKLLSESRDKPVRIWVVACSTGQEVYSIAMSFVESAERFGQMRKLQIFATDVNEKVLNKARAGLFAKNLMGGISPERMRRFFVEEDGGFRVAKFLRDMVVFARQNVISDPPFSRMDLISCRNLFIYLDQDVQRKVLPAFHYALKPGGFLFLGESESISAVPDLFEAIEKKGKIFSRNSGLTPNLRFMPPATEKKASIPLQIPAAAEGAQGQVNTQREADRVTLSRFAPPSVLIDLQGQILQFRGETGPFLRPPNGNASFSILKMAREGLMLPLRTAIKKAKDDNRYVRQENISVVHGAEKLRVNFEVVPLSHLKERCFLIFFELVQDPAIKSSNGRGKTSVHGRQVSRSKKISKHKYAEPTGQDFSELERELADTRAYLQSIQEQHEVASEEVQASNEEVTSANEELQSINEELETSKEELESANEELVTVNDELGLRNEELNHYNAELLNLQASVKLPILVLSRELTVRRFTSGAQELFNLTANDVGRPLSHIRHRLQAPHLESVVKAVIDSASERDQTVSDDKGHWYSLRIRPYLTLENKVEGAILVLVDIDKVTRSEKNAAASRDFAEAILRTTRYPLVVLTEDFRVHTANAAFYRMFHVQPGETENRLIYDLGSGHWNITKLKHFLEDILPRNSILDNFEATFDLGKLGIRSVLLSARKLDKIGDGGSQRILLTIDDITESKQHEAVKLSELRYRRLFEAAKDGVLIVDPKTQTIKDANPFMAQLLGVPHETMIGKNLCEIGLYPNNAACAKVFQKLREKTAIREKELPCQTASGEYRVMEMVANLYREGDQEVIQCNIRDITERIKAEGALAEQARLLNLSSDCIVVCDWSNRVTYWNKSAEEILGFTWSEAMGRPLHELLASEFSESYENILTKLQRDNRWSGEIIQTCKNGRRIITAARWGLDRGPEGLPRAILKTFNDITEHQVIERSIREARDRLANQAGELETLVAERTEKLSETVGELEAFSYSIAHDLRAPLRAMHTFADHLVMECQDRLNEKGLDYLKRIVSASNRMDNLIRDVLNYSRVVRMDVPMVGVNVRDLLTGILDSYPHLQSASADIVLEGDFPFVMANEAMLTQCISNLLGNAVKFVDPGVKPQVRVWATPGAGRVRIFFNDNGIGVESDAFERIFTIFQRQSTSFEGTGIGLAIVKKAVQRMGGSVGLESTLGQGSTFWIELPTANNIPT